METEFIPCTPKFLENGKLLEAARIAIEQNPANRPAVEQSGVSGMVLPPEHLAILTSKWWGNKGVRLTVGFLEVTPSDLQQRILSHMNAWSQWANVSFVLAADPQVRITRAGDGYWSYLGTDILTIPRGQPTMSLQAFTMQTPESEYRRVVRHETGHCLVGSTLIDCPRDLRKYPAGIPIKDLVGKQPHVYCWKDGGLAICKASNVWLSRKAAQIIRVRLSPGQGYHTKAFLPPQELVGTAEHRVLLADGHTWKALGELRPGDRLSSIYRSKNGERSRIRWTGGERVREHTFVCEQVYGPRPLNHDAHHKNENKLDQSTDNLEWKAESLHCSDHSKGRKLSEEHKAKLAEANRNRDYTEEIRARMSAAGTNRPPISEETRAKISAASKGRKQSAETIAKRTAAMCRYYANGGRSGMYGKKASEETRAKHRAAWVRRRNTNNHVVLSVEAAGEADVYDMTVPDAESFVANGVIVHNCLGAPHEHMRRSIIQRIDPEKAIAYFRQTQGWSASMVQAQVLTPLAESSIMATPDADENSIMTYSLPGIITKDGRPIIGGVDIEEQDQAFIATIYPKAPSPPPPPVATGLDLSMDFTRKVLSLNLPAGWTVTKSSTTEEAVMSFELLASELESTIPTKAMDASRAAAPGGIISAVLNLVTALRAGDIKGIAVALRDLLNILLADQGGTEISFQQQAQAAGINWSRLIGVLLKILPLILRA